MKKILITGGSKGIGLACVHKFLAKGWHVICCSRNESTWQENSREHVALSKVEYYVCDVSNQADVDLLFSNIKRNHSHIDAAINNASPAVSSEGNFKDVSLGLLRETMESDLWPTILCLNHELNIMKEGAGIVNITSVNGIRPIPGAAMYGVAKHGIESLTKSVALEAISHKIRINSIAPGVTWTPRWEARAKDNADIRQAVENLVPLKRFAIPDEVANSAYWLLSDQASYIVGHTLVIDGGLSLK